MSHETTQPTLDRTTPATPAENLQALTLLETAALLAIHRATLDRAPITTSAYLTEALFVLLEKRRVLQRCDEEDLRRPDGLQRAIYDPVCWRYLGDWQATPLIGSAIEGRLRTCAGSEHSLHDRLQLWRALADAEAEGYLAHLLRRHAFEARWAMDLAPIPWESGITLSQMRYVIWASVREGAAAFLRTSSDSDHARNVIASAVRRRAQWIAGRPDVGQSFVPQASARPPLLLTIFLSDVAPLGRAYWLSTPTLDALRATKAPDFSSTAIHTSEDHDD
ncbi:MAG: hypothetical protein ACTHK2_11225 [Dokdonella sp.]|uniref:hypothetical protein n=1 Tax=Dokdonella sp. TaxID=2291710 RepID=UPI003F8231F5